MVGNDLGKFGSAPERGRLGMAQSMERGPSGISLRSFLVMH